MGMQSKKPPKPNADDLADEWFAADRDWLELFRQMTPTSQKGTELLGQLPVVIGRYRDACVALADLADAAWVDAETALPLRELALELKDYRMPDGVVRAFRSVVFELRARCWVRVRRIRVMVKSVKRTTTGTGAAKAVTPRLDQLAMAAIATLENEDEHNLNQKPDWQPGDVATLCGLKKSSPLFNKTDGKYRHPQFMKAWRKQESKLAALRRGPRSAVTRDVTEE